MATRVLVGLALVAGVESQHLRGEKKTCKDGRQHVVTYDVQQKISDDQIVSLNEPSMNISAVQCDLDGSKVHIKFPTNQAGTSFCGKLAKGMFVVGGGQYGCVQKSTGTGGVLMKRAERCVPDGADNTSVILHGGQLQYTEVYDSMNVTFHSNPSDECEAQEAHERRLQLFPTCPPAEWCCADAKTGTKNACIPCAHTILGHCNDLGGSSKDETCASQMMDGEPMMPSDNCVSPGPTPIPGPDHHKLVCLGVNMDPTTCTQAKAPISIYTNGILDISCDKCFAGFTTDIFFNINLNGGYLHEIQAGFRKTGIHAGVELAMHAEKRWSAGIDKDLWAWNGANTPLIHFNIGPIPFMIWFESSGHFKADISMDATADAKAGLFGDYNIGDNYVSWDLQRHWQHITSEPTMTHSTTVEGTASVKNHADVTQTFNVAMHLDQIFTSTLSFAPTAQMDINVLGDIHDIPKVCESASYDAALNLAMQLHVDLPFHIMDINKAWSRNLWEREGQIPEVCKNITGPTSPSTAPLTAPPTTRPAAIVI